MTDNDVVVVGAGPTGLVLACELALGGVGVRVLEARTTTPNITRAFAVHARTLELLDARGLGDQLVPRGVQVPEISPAPGATLDLTELESRYRMLLVAPQCGTERMLESRAEELGVPIERGARVVSLTQDDDGVTIGLADGTTTRASYVVGCDGAHSAVRRLAGVEFTGKQYETHILLADIRLHDVPSDPLFARTNADGAVIIVPFGDGWFRAIAWDRRSERTPLAEPVTLAEIRDAFGRIAGEDFGMSEMRWSSRFLSERRQAERYQVGRVFLAGDAAHVHSPLGGQGMNTGIGDAMNLGWKLAATLRGDAPDWLLASYQGERHPVGATVLMLTDAFNQLVLGRSPVRRAVQKFVIRSILRFGPSRRMLRGRLTGLGIAYPAGRRDHRLVGRRMPDVDCGDHRLYELLRSGHFVLVTSRPADVDGLGVVAAVHRDAGLPAAVLVRPDGYVAWAGERVPTRGEAARAVGQWQRVVDRDGVGGKSDARTEDRPHRPEVPGAGAESDGQPDRQAHHGHQQVAGKVEVH